MTYYKSKWFTVELLNRGFEAFDFFCSGGVSTHSSPLVMIKSMELIN